MKVLVVHNSYRFPGGEERVVESTTRILRESGVEVLTLSRDSSDLADSPTGALHAFCSGIWSRSARRQAARLLEEHRPDVVHVHNLYPLLSPSVLVECARHGTPVVMTCHSYRLICPIGVMFSHGAPCDRCVEHGAHWCLLRNCTGDLLKSAAYVLRHVVAQRFGWFRRCVTEFITPSAFVRDRLVASGWPADRFHVVPHAVPLPDEAPDAAEPGRFAAYVGRISPEKGVDVLLEAARQRPDIPVRIAGEGPLPSPLPPNVLALGRMPADRMPGFYRDARFTVVPSVCAETFSLSAAESLVHGTPVVGSRAGAIPEVVDDGVSGLLFESGNARELADTMGRLWAAPETCREMGAAGRSSVARRCSREAHLEALMGVYNLAIERKAGTGA